MIAPATLAAQSARFSSFSAGAAPVSGLKAALNAPALRGLKISPDKSAGLDLPTASIELHAPYLREWPVRDQFGRGTCVAFAAIAMLELYRAHRDEAGLPDRWSEHLFYRLLRQAGLAAIEAERSTLSKADWAAGATTLEMALDVLRAPAPTEPPTVGWNEAYRPVAEGMPVSGAAQPDDIAPPFPLDLPDILHGWKRPEDFAANTEGHAPRTPTANAYPGPDAPSLTTLFCDRLAAGCPVAAGFPTFPHDGGHTNWTLPGVWRSGRVMCPQDAGAPRFGAADGSGHVVCITGFRPDAEEPSGGWFMFRNSWGLGFASAAARGVPARGYGLISATHVDLYCWEFLTPAAASAEPTTSASSSG